MALKYSAVQCSNMQEDCHVPYRENKSFQAGIIVLLAVSSMLINQHYILNKMSLYRNTYKTMLFIDLLIKMFWSEGHMKLTLYFP